MAAGGPAGAEAATGPRGVAVENAQGGVLVSTSSEGAYAARATIGTRVAVFLETATEVAIADQVYYFDSGVYYQVIDDDYVIVADPNAQKIRIHFK